jgi:hypothetical protein
MAAFTNVRLADSVLTAIREIFAKHFLATDQIWLFGAKIGPNNQGSEINLYIETNLATSQLAVTAKLKFLTQITIAIDDHKIDVVLNVIALANDLPIYAVAKETGVRLS